MIDGPETLPPTDETLDRAAAVLESGGSVVLPTDTVYGLAALAARPDATAHLFRLKGRSDGQPMAVLVADAAQARSLVAPPSSRVEAWMAELWPGPLTLVLRRSAPAVALELGGTDETIGVRCPDHPWVRSLAARVGPIATTSANRSGEPTPTTAEEAAAGLVARLDLVVDGGTLVGTASTVIDATSPDGRWHILRAGPIDPSALADP